MTDTTKEHLRNEARLRIIETRETMELSKQQLAGMATILEKVARMLRMVPSQFTAMLSDSQDQVARTQAIMAEAALDHKVVALAVADFVTAKQEYDEALNDGLKIGVIC